MTDALNWVGRERRRTRTGFVEMLPSIVTVAFTYHLLAQLGLFFAIPPGFATVFWPASGVGLAAVLLRGQWMMLGVLLGSFSVNLYISLQLHHQTLGATTFGIALGIAISSSLQAGLGGWLIRRWLQRRQGQLAQLRHLLVLVGLGGPIGCIVAATGGTSILVALGIMAPSQWWLNWLTWWMGDTLGVVVIAPALVIVAQSSASVSTIRKLQVCLPLLILFSLLAFGYSRFENQTLTRFEAEIDSLTDGAYLDVQGKLMDYERSLVGVVSFYTSSDFVTDKEFETHTRALIRSSPSLLALQWVPKVSRDELLPFEIDAKKNIGDFYSVHDNDHPKLVQTEHRDVYYPVRYVQPEQENETVLGFDMASSAVRREAIELALTTGRSVATAPISLLQREGESGFLIIFPEAPRSNQNVIVGVFRIEPVFRSVSHQLASFPLKLNVTDANSGDQVYSRGDVQNDQQNDLIEDRFTVVKTVAFGQRTWLMEFSPSVTFISEYMYRYMAPVLLSAMAFLGLLSLFVLSTAVSAMTLEQEIKNTELNLKDEEQFLTAVLDNLPSAIAVREVSTMTCVKLNQRARKLWNITQEDEGIHYEQWMEPEEVQFQLNEDRRAIRLGEAIELDIREVNTTRGRKWLKIKKVPVRDSNKNIKYIISIYDDVTERQEEHETFNSVVENLPSALLIVNAHARIEYANPAAFNAFPLDKKLTPLNRIIPERFHQGHSNLVKSFMERNENRRMAPARDLYALDIHGEEIPVEITLTSIRWRGQPAVMALVKDLSDRRRAEYAEEEAKQFFRRLLEGMGECVWSVTQEGVATFVNPALCDLLGYDKSELMGRNVDHLIAFDDDANVMDRVNPVYVAMHKMHAVKGANKVLRAKDGSLLPVDYVVTPQINLAGEAEGAIVVAGDVRERIAALEKLRSQHELITIGLEASGLGWWQWSAETNQIECDANLSRIFGLDPDEPYGDYRDFLARVYPEDREHVEKKTNKHSHSTDLYEMVYRIVRSDERVRWIHVRARYDIDDQANPIRMQGVAWDCTDQKQIEQSLIDQTKAFEIKNEQFLDYANIVQQEISKPIRMVMDLSHRLIDEHGKSESDLNESYLHELEAIGEYVQNKLADLTFYADVESKVLKLERVDTVELVNDLLDTLLPVFQVAKIDCRIETPLSNIKAHKLYVEEVFKRLIDNAISHNSSDPIKVRLGSAKRSGKDLFYIADNGQGIDQEKLETLFESDVPRPAPELGTEDEVGVSLLIVKKIIERHGGSVFTESEEGKGTVVYFRFS